MSMGTCKSCGAPIKWAVTDEKRRFIPLDPEASRDGNVLVIDPHFATHRGPAWLVTVLTDYHAEGKRDSGERLYVSHFKTCPDSGRHRRRS